jgi:hypothetical protein
MYARKLSLLVALSIGAVIVSTAPVLSQSQKIPQGECFTKCYNVINKIYQLCLKNELGIKIPPADLQAYCTANYQNGQKICQEETSGCQ